MSPEPGPCSDSFQQASPAVLRRVSIPHTSEFALQLQGSSTRDANKTTGALGRDLVTLTSSRFSFNLSDWRSFSQPPSPPTSSASAYRANANPPVRTSMSINNDAGGPFRQALRSCSHTKSPAAGEAKGDIIPVAVSRHAPPATRPAAALPPSTPRAVSPAETESALCRSVVPESTASSTPVDKGTFPL